MSKTVTMRMDDQTYQIIKRAAEGQRRTLSNYLEFAALNYTLGELLVDDPEMDEIMESRSEILKGLADVEAGRYHIVE